jgi:hypothetical protein
MFSVLATLLAYTTVERHLAALLPLDLGAFPPPLAIVTKHI